jgi:hypothetical protein
MSDPLTFFSLLVLVFSLPFWGAAFAVDDTLMPGLPVSAVSVVVPAIAALLASARWGGRASVRALIARTGEVRHLPLAGWLAALGLPLLMVGAEWAWRAVSGHPVAWAVTPFGTVTLAALFLVSAYLEELGWTAFATDRLIRRFGLFGGALVLGLGWVIWHLPAFAALGRSVEWVAWWSLWTVVQRLVMVALYVRMGRNFAVPVLFHALANLLWQAAPEAFDPRFEAMTISVIALALFFWQARRSG